MLNKNTVKDIRNEFVRLYNNKDFRTLYKGTEREVRTIEIQNANFIADEDWIVREPNRDYAQREIEWYKSQSLYVDDIPGKTPVIWEQCADSKGKINSNYGWCIWSNENGNQYRNCLLTLVKDPQSRQAAMIYNRPSMHEDATYDGRHDFMCTYSTQVFLNERDDHYELKYIVYMRSNDAVMGFNNDLAWHQYVAKRLAEDLSERLGKEVRTTPIEWNAGSLHVYERHFKYLDNKQE